MITLLTEEQVRITIDSCKDTAEATIVLHRITVPNFDNLERVERPLINKKTNMAIMQMMIDKDRRDNVKHMKGGNWLNWGFGTDETLKDWEVKSEEATI